MFKILTVINQPGKYDDIYELYPAHPYWLGLIYNFF